MGQPVMILFLCYLGVHGYLWAASVAILGRGMSSDLRFSVTVILLCLLWYSIGSTNNILNKVILQKFPYPLTVTMSSLFGIAVYSIPILKLWKINKLYIPRHYKFKYIVPLSLGKVLAVSASYFSLWNVPVSYAHTVKATMPLFAVICARVILGEVQTFPVYMSLVPIVSGVVIASFTEMSFNLAGLFCALCSTFTYAVLNTFVKKILQDTGLHHLKLLCILSQIACVFCLPLWCLHDAVNIWKDVTSEQVPAYVNFRTVWLVILSGFLNFAQNICTFTLIHKLSALSYAVANATKRITVITSSLVTLKNPVNTLNLFGMFLAVVGVFGYNQAKQYQKLTEHKVTGLPMSLTHTTLSDATLLGYNDEILPALPTKLPEKSEIENSPVSWFIGSKNLSGMFNGFVRRTAPRPTSHSSHPPSFSVHVGEEV